MITPTSVLPYMLHGGTPKASSTKSQVLASMGSPVKESFRGPKRRAAAPDSRIMR
jgi:hypothetical protein